jgi:hypothetical protein
MGQLRRKKNPPKKQSKKGQNNGNSRSLNGDDSSVASEFSTATGTSTISDTISAGLKRRDTTKQPILVPTTIGRPPPPSSTSQGKSIRRAVTATVVSGVLINGGIKYAKRQRARQEEQEANGSQNRILDVPSHGEAADSPGRVNIDDEETTKRSSSSVGSNVDVDVKRVTTVTGKADPKCFVPFSHIFMKDCNDQMATKPLFSMDEISNMMME